MLRGTQMPASALAEVENIGGELLTEEAEGPQAALNVIYRAPDRPAARRGVVTERRPDLQAAEELAGLAGRHVLQGGQGEKGLLRPRARGGAPAAGYSRPSSEPSR